MRFDRQGRHLFVNSATSEVTGIESRHFLGKTHRELGFPENQCQYWEHKIRIVYDLGKPFETDMDLNGVNGSAVFNWRLIPEVDRHGRTVGVLGVGRDITAHRQAERNYRILFNQMIDGFALHDIIGDGRGRPVDYRIFSVNPAFERLTGLNRDAILGRCVSQVFADTEALWVETFKRVALTGTPGRFEYDCRKPDRFFTVFAFRPQKSQIACIVRDMTDSKNAQFQLKKQLRYLEILLDTVPVPIFSKDVHGCYSSCNRAFEEFLGKSARQIIGQSDQDLKLWNIADKRHASDLDLVNNPGRHACELNVEMKHGAPREIIVNESTILETDGRVSGIIGAISDITENKAAARQLRKNEERFRAIADYTYNWETWIAPDGKLIWVNPAVEKITGYSREAYLNLPDRISDRFRLVFHEDDLEGVIELFEDGLRDRKNVNDFATRIRRKEGTIRWVAVSFQPIYSPAGDYLGLRASIRDITEKKLAEETLQRRDMELRKNTEHLEKVNKALKDLLDHREIEKRAIEESIQANLKKLIIPYLEKLKNAKLNEDARTYLDIVRTNLNDLISPVSNRLASKFTNLTPTEIEVADLIRQGKSSKEISYMLNVSLSSISFHRYNIRKKLNLLNKKINLGAYLLSLSD